MIPDEAVEAAYGQVLSDDALRYVNTARLRRILEAAEPYMLAQAWDQGESAGRGNYGRVLRRKTNPYRSQA